ncbi:MAG: helix-turn-helix domain-containing protein [Myxococcota bacterium]|nr:helix-turn-helix domain-containing protein [Myxococcota bacterium]
MPEAPDVKRESILSAAHLQFARYGYRRTSMEDIAKETGVSRASLYSYFENKEEIFRSLTAHLQEQSLAAAEHCLKEGGSDVDVATRVEAALLARLTPFLEVVQSAHGSELYDENNRLCGDLVVASSERFLEILTTALAAAARAGQIDLKSAGLSAAATAELIYRSAAGLKQGAADMETVTKRLRSFVAVFFAGLRA